MSEDFENSNYLDYLDCPDIPLLSYFSKDFYIGYRFARAALSSCLIRLYRLSLLLFAWSSILSLICLSIIKPYLGLFDDLLKEDTLSLLDFDLFLLT